MSHLDCGILLRCWLDYFTAKVSMSCSLRGRKRAREKTAVRELQWDVFLQVPASDIR